MQKLALIGCSKSKKQYKCSAMEMYSESELFKKTYKYCIKNKFSKIKILSAKYGMILPNLVIEPYDLSLYDMNKKEIDIWAKKIADKLNITEFEIHFMCGKKYYEPIIKYLKNSNFKIPMIGLGIGERLKYLK